MATGPKIHGTRASRAQRQLGDAHPTVLTPAEDVNNLEFYEEWYFQISHSAGCTERGVAEEHISAALEHLNEYISERVTGKGTYTMYRKARIIDQDKYVGHVFACRCSGENRTSVLRPGSVRRTGCKFRLEARVFKSMRSPLSRVQNQMEFRISKVLHKHNHRPIMPVRGTASAVESEDAGPSSLQLRASSKTPHQKLDKVRPVPSTSARGMSDGGRREAALAEKLAMAPEEWALRRLRVRVYWGGDKKWYSGTIARFDRRNRMHLVDYDDGECEMIYLLKGSRDRFEFIEDDKPAEGKGGVGSADEMRRQMDGGADGGSRRGGPGTSTEEIDDDDDDERVVRGRDDGAADGDLGTGVVRVAKRALAMTLPGNIASNDQIAELRGKRQRLRNDIQRELQRYKSVLKERMESASEELAVTRSKLRSTEALTRHQKEELQCANAKISRLEGLLEEKTKAIASYQGVINDLLKPGRAKAAAGNSS